MKRTVGRDDDGKAFCPSANKNENNRREVKQTIVHGNDFIQ